MMRLSPARSLSARFVAGLLLLVVFAGQAMAQIDDVKKRSEDAFQELESGKLTLRFLNALNGEGIAGGTVLIADDSLVTDWEGKVLFTPPSPDTTLNVRFSAPKYITSEFSVEVMAGSLFFNRISISPAMEVRQLRVVLDWGRRPRDLDAHLVKRGDYHISYRNMRTSSDGKGVLDRDDRDGYGPETITVKEVSRDADYEYYVHDYSNRHTPSSRELSASRAVVKVFGEGRLMKMFELRIFQPGTVWRVFRIRNGEVIETNELDREE